MAKKRTQQEILDAQIALKQLFKPGCNIYYIRRGKGPSPYDARQVFSVLIPDVDPPAKLYIRSITKLVADALNRTYHAAWDGVYISGYRSASAEELTNEIARMLWPEIPAGAVGSCLPWHTL